MRTFFLSIAVIFSCTVSTIAEEVSAPSWSVQSFERTKIDQDTYDDSHVLLVFYRGVTCVHCMEQLAAMAKNKTEFEDRKIQIIAISRELPGTGSVHGIRKANKIKFPMCIDPQKEEFRSFGCLGRRGREMHGLVLISPEKKILWKSVTEGAVTDIDKILKKCDQVMSNSN